MRFFIDTANVDDIKKANDMGVICGVTTNPSLIAKEGKKFEDVIAEIAEDLYDDCQINEYTCSEDPRDVAWEEKYVKITYGGKAPNGGAGSSV